MWSMMWVWLFAIGAPVLHLGCEAEERAKLATRFSTMWLPSLRRDVSGTGIAVQDCTALPLGCRPGTECGAEKVGDDPESG